MNISNYKNFVTQEDVYLIAVERNPLSVYTMKDASEIVLDKALNRALEMEIDNISDFKSYIASRKTKLRKI